jgi:hypothetical protein
MKDGTTPTRPCLTPGCSEPVAGIRDTCLPCSRHRDLMQALGRHKPSLAQPSKLGRERFCGNCSWFAEGAMGSQREGDTSVWVWKPFSRHGWGECRGALPRSPPHAEGDAFPPIHAQQWCKFHQRRHEGAAAPQPEGTPE